FRDVQQPIFSWKYLDKGTKRHNGFHFSFINFPHLRFGRNGLNPAHSIIDGSFIGGKYLHDSFIVYLLDGNSGTGFALHFLYDFTAWSDHGPNKLFVNAEAYDARGVWFIIFTRGRNGFLHLIQDVQSSF